MTFETKGRLPCLREEGPVLRRLISSRLIATGTPEHQFLERGEGVAYERKKSLFQILIL